MKSASPVNALPYPIYFWTLVCIAGIGLLDTIYLSLSHYWNYTDISYASFCALSKSLNCDTVSQSSFSVFLGLPVAVWGGVGYLLWLLLMVFAYRGGGGAVNMYSLLIFLAVIYCLVSLRLAYISAVYVRASCIMCILSWAVNFFLLFFAWLTRRRFCPGGYFKGLIDDIKLLWQARLKTLALAAPLAVLLLILFVAMPRYWIFTVDYTKNIPQGMTKDGHPWIGAENPELLIEEFTDYLCFQCAKMHFYLRRLVQRNPDKVRLVHRHYPMDHEFNDVLVKRPYHVGSGKLSLVAIYAGIRGKFWEVNDYFFINARSVEAIDLEALAEKFGLDPNEIKVAPNHPKLKRFLNYEIIQGMKLNIIGTPSYIINGKLYEGQLPENLFEGLDY